MHLYALNLISINFAVKTFLCLGQCLNLYRPIQVSSSSEVK